jgi:hypothetical protein
MVRHNAAHIIVFHRLGGAPRPGFATLLSRILPLLHVLAAEMNTREARIGLCREYRGSQSDADVWREDFP